MPDRSSSANAGTLPPNIISIATKARKHETKPDRFRVFVFCWLPAAGAIRFVSFMASPSRRARRRVPLRPIGLLTEVRARHILHGQVLRIVEERGDHQPL